MRDEISVTFINDKVDARRLLSMNYFHMVFQETLRLFPIAATMSRQLTGDIKLGTFVIHDLLSTWTKKCELTD